MKNKTSITNKLGIPFYVLLCIIILCGCNYTVVDIDKVKTALERAYFEGQKDALNGDVRIRKNFDSHCPHYEGYMQENLSHEVCGWCVKISYYH